jgi:rubrerythrin
LAYKISEREKKQREETVELLQKQIKTEGQLISLYEEYLQTLDNKAVQRILHMIKLDSQKHIDILQTSIDIIQGTDVLIKDRKDIRESLIRHLEIEKESLDIANKILKNTWVNDNKGLKELITGWRDDERRHHRALKTLSEKTFIEIDSNDMVYIFRGEEWMEERYLRSKQFHEKKDKQ